MSRLPVLLVALTGMAALFAGVGPDGWAVPAQEWGLSVSTNFASFLLIGLLEELPSAPPLIGFGGYGRFTWIWGLHGRPWVQTYPGADRTRLAAGFDLLWADPQRGPEMTYVGFGFSLTNFLPLPITNFVLGVAEAGEDCGYHLEVRFLFLTSLEGGWGCAF